MISIKILFSLREEQILLLSGQRQKGSNTALFQVEDEVNQSRELLSRWQFGVREDV